MTVVAQLLRVAAYSITAFKQRFSFMPFSLLRDFFLSAVYENFQLAFKRRATTTHPTAVGIEPTAPANLLKQA